MTAVLLWTEPNQVADAQHGVELDRSDSLAGITEKVMDLASPSISINTLTESS